MVKSHPNDSGHTHAIPTSATHMHKNLRCGIMAQKSSWPARSPLPSSRGSAGRGGAGFIRGGWPDGRGGQATKRRPARLAPMRCRRSGTMTPAGAGGRGACAGAPPRAAWGSQQGMPRQPLAALCRITVPWGRGVVGGGRLLAPEAACVRRARRRGARTPDALSPESARRGVGAAADALALSALAAGAEQAGPAAAGLLPPGEAGSGPAGCKEPKATSHPRPPITCVCWRWPQGGPATSNHAGEPLAK